MAPPGLSPIITQPIIQFNAREWLVPFYQEEACSFGSRNECPLQGDGRLSLALVLPRGFARLLGMGSEAASRTQRSTSGNHAAFREDGTFR